MNLKTFRDQLMKTGEAPKKEKLWAFHQQEISSIEEDDTKRLEEAKKGLIWSALVGTEQGTKRPAVMTAGRHTLSVLPQAFSASSIFTAFSTSSLSRSTTLAMPFRSMIT